MVIRNIGGAYKDCQGSSRGCFKKHPSLVALRRPFFKERMSLPASTCNASQETQAQNFSGEITAVTATPYFKPRQRLGWLVGSKAIAVPLPSVQDIYVCMCVFCCIY